MWRSVPLATMAVGLLACGLVVYGFRGFEGRLREDSKAYSAVVAATEDWGFPDRNCVQERVVSRCIVGGSGISDVVVVGDSHAQQWYPRFSERARESGYAATFVTQGGCPPIRGLDPLSSRRSACPEFAEALWREILENPPKKLIITSFWRTYFYDSSGNVRQDFCIKGLEQCVPIMERSDIKRAFSVFTSDVSSLIAKGTTVYLVGPMPSSDIDYPKTRMEELSARHLPLLIGMPDAREDGHAFRYSEGADSPEEYLLAILRGVAKQSGASLVEPANFMCPDGSCSFIDADGVPIYRDNNHLTRSYVQSRAAEWLDSQIGIQGNSSP